MTQKINRTSAATAARMRASEEKMAAKLRERGWTCTRSPSLRHFVDTCMSCRRTGMRSVEVMCIPYGRILETEAGSRFTYRCPMGHEWTCWYSKDRALDYFSDCPCDYCHQRRDEAGEEHWTPLPVYNITRK